ncbi:homoserine kinase [Helicobacter sp. 23-1045]
MIVRIPATSANLGPGFDSLGLALSLYNDFQVKPSILQSIKIKGEGEGIPKLIKDNNFIKIFKETCESIKSGDLAQSSPKKATNPPKNLNANHLNQKFANPKFANQKIINPKDSPKPPKANFLQKNFSFYLENQIPISRGLGSSSAVIVGAIVSAFQILGIKYTKDMIINRALKYEKHPDNITPAVNGGFNVAMLKNNRVFYVKTRIANDIKAVVVIPNKPISTKHSRRAIPRQIALQDAVFNLSRASMIASIFAQKRWQLLKVVGDDKIHQDLRMGLFPALFSVRKEAMKNGALMSVLSGSGSTFLNICYRDDAPKIAGILAKKFSEFRVLDLEFDNNGISIL